MAKRFTGMLLAIGFVTALLPLQAVIHVCLYGAGSAPAAGAPASDTPPVCPPPLAERPRVSPPPTEPARAAVAATDANPINCRVAAL